MTAFGFVPNRTIRSVTLHDPGSPTVAVVVPTLNSQRTLGECLNSVRRQSYRPVEIVVVDSFSKDDTVTIGKRFARLIQRDCGMTEARLIGAETVGADLVLNLDSDQVLAPDAVQRCIETGRSIVALGESSSGRGLVSAMNRADRDEVDRHWRANLDPRSGSIRPRLYERITLIRALKKIPESLIHLKPAPYSEDSIIYLNSGASPGDVGYVPRAVTHLEDPSLLSFATKWFGYGKSAKVYHRTDLEFLVWGRGRRFVRRSGFVRTLPARVLKGVPFILGYYL